MPIETAVICWSFLLVFLPSVSSEHHPHNRAVFKRVDTPNGSEYIEIDNKPIGNIEFEKHSYPVYNEANERTDYDSLKPNAMKNGERKVEEIIRQTFEEAETVKLEDYSLSSLLQLIIDSVQSRKSDQMFSLMLVASSAIIAAILYL